MAEPKLRFKEFESKVEIRKLGNISNIVVGFVGTVSDQYCDQNEGIPFIRTQNVRDGYFSVENLEYVTKDFHKKNKKSQIFNGDVLIARVGANMGMVCAVENLNTEANCANVIIIKKNPELNSQYLSLFLNSENGQKQIHSGGAGGAQAVFNTTLAKEISFPYFPLDEQTKIASFLSSVDEKISQLSQKHELLSQYKQGMMQKLFSQQIRFKADDGCEFGEWEKKKLSEISIKIKDGTHFSPKTSEVGDYKYLTSKNVKDGYLDFSNLEYVTKEEHLKIYSSCDVKYGDVLLTKDGTIGQCCVNTLHEEFSLLSSVAFLRLKPEYNNYFLYHLLVSDLGQKEISSAIAGQALKRITLTKINDFSFCFPCLAEQTKIANFLSAIDQKIEVVARQIEQAKQWKKGLLQQMFV